MIPLGSTVYYHRKLMTVVSREKTLVKLETSYDNDQILLHISEHGVLGAIWIECSPFDDEDVCLNLLRAYGGILKRRKLFGYNTFYIDRESREIRDILNSLNDANYHALIETGRQIKTPSNSRWYYGRYFLSRKDKWVSICCNPIVLWSHLRDLEKITTISEESLKEIGLSIDYKDICGTTYDLSEIYNPLDSIFFRRKNEITWELGIVQNKITGIENLHEVITKKVYTDFIPCSLDIIKSENLTLKDVF